MLVSPLEQFVVFFFSPWFFSLGDPYCWWMVLFGASNIGYQLFLLLSLLAFVSGFVWLQQIEFFNCYRVLLFYYNGFVRSFVSENFSRFVRYFYSFFFFFFSFLVLANLSGMVPYSFAITSHLVVTLFFSFAVFFCCLFFGFYFWGLGFLDLFFPRGAPFILAPFLVSIELISYMARLFSLAIRLFANIMSGHTLLKILAGFGWVLLFSAISFVGFAPVVIVCCVSALEVVIGFLQAYVFCVLAAIYFNEAFYLH